MNHEMQERKYLFKFEMKLRETKLKLQAEHQGKQAIQTAQTRSEEISARAKLPKVEITVRSVELIETGPSFGVNFLRQ